MFTSPLVAPVMLSSSTFRDRDHYRGSETPSSASNSTPRIGRLRRLSILQSKSANILRRSLSHSPSRISRRTNTASCPENQHNNAPGINVDRNNNNNNNNNPSSVEHTSSSSRRANRRSTASTASTSSHDDNDIDDADSSDSHSTSPSNRSTSRERRRRTVFNPLFAPIFAPSSHSRAASHSAVPSVVKTSTTSPTTSNNTTATNATTAAAAAAACLTSPQDSDSQPSSANSDSHAVAVEQPSMTRTRAATNGETASAPNALSDNVPSIRFSAYYDPRSTRPSLTFSPIARSLPTGSETIRVGRYSERDSQTSNNAPGNQPSAAPVGFKSKVVSRRHCEFWCEDGKWYIRDVKSSSGTFLNHIRLSPPSQESKAFPINDGDIVQLGIDFKGGEEMIFRCVKMRVELNRGWQNKINIFNTAALNNLRRMAKNGSSGGSSGSQDCSICLNSIQPCQSLFVAPCSHTWHFKCVRALLTSPQYPSFMCPNCRASADLEADVEDVSEEWEQLGQETEAKNQEPPKIEQQPTAQAEANREAHDAAEPSLVNDVADMTLMAAAPSSPPQPPPAADSSHTPSAPVPIKSNTLHPRDPRTPSPPGMGHEGPITPRNDAGPWVFDGSAGGGEAGDATVIIRSIDAAADIVMTDNTSSDTASR